MSLRTHFEQRAHELAGLAILQVSERSGVVYLRLQPKSPKAVAVTLYLLGDRIGTVALDDQACAPGELSDDPEADRSSIDKFIDLAVAGRATAFHLGRGGCIEERARDGRVSRTWMNAWPWPGWRRRAIRVEYAPYT